MNNVGYNIKEIRREIVSLQKQTGASRHVELVAVSKKQPDDRIDAALEAGQRVFGENRVQEAQQRWTERRSQYKDLQLHLIGPLQTNKARDAVALFDVIETLDRAKLAKTLAHEMQKQDRHLPCFIQVNTGDEEQKAGITINELLEFYQLCAKNLGLKIDGLMCIPPVDDPPAPHFAMLNKLAKELGLQKLSMGMSADYDKAIPLGATHIRVGTGVFGARPNPIASP